MTRKRFIKLLMSEDENRNNANIIANILRAQRKTYEEYVKAVYWDTDKIMSEFWQKVAEEND